MTAASGTKRWGRGWGHTGWCRPIFHFISLPLSWHSQARWGKGHGGPHSDMMRKSSAFLLRVWETQNELPGAEPFGAAKGCGCWWRGSWGAGRGSSPAGMLGEQVSPRCSWGPHERVFAAPLTICSCHCRRGAPTSQAADRSL